MPIINTPQAYKTMTLAERSFCFIYARTGGREVQCYARAFKLGRYLEIDVYDLAIALLDREDIADEIDLIKNTLIGLNISYYFFGFKYEQIISRFQHFYRLFLKYI